MRYSFWSRQGLLSGLLYALFIIIHFLLRLSMNFTAGDLSEMDTLPLTTPLIIIIVFACLKNFDYYRTVIPTALCFSQTRTDIIVGLQLNRLISLFFLTVLAAIASVCSGFNIATLCVSSFLCLTAAGSMVGLAGRNLSESACSILFSMVILISAIASSIIWTLVLVEALPPQTGWYLIGFSVPFYGLFCVYEAKKLRSFSVM